MKVLCSFLAGWILGTLSVTVSLAQPSAVITVDTNMPEAFVYADSLRLGRALEGTFQIPASTQRLRLVPPDRGTWAIAPVSAPMTVELGDTLTVRLRFPYYYQIETEPFGATVFVDAQGGRTSIGKTPVLYTTPSVPKEPFVVEREGYLIESVEPGREVWNRHVLTLRPLVVPEDQAAERSLHPPAKQRRWIDYTAGIVAVMAGVASVHYKFKADRINDRYQLTGDPTLRPRIRSLDTRSAVALGVMQGGLGVLVVRFALR